MVRHAKHILLALMSRTVRLSAIAEFFCARYMFADFSDCNVKTLLESVNRDQKYRKNKSGLFLVHGVHLNNSKKLQPSNLLV